MREATSSPAALGSEPISKLLLRYALPAIVAMTSSSLYNIIDSIFVGNGVGALAIAGMAVTLPLMNIMSAFGSMVGIGAASRISISLGQGDKRHAERVLGNAVVLNVVFALVLTTLTLAFLDDILRAFGASDITIGYARDFMTVIISGNIITHLYLTLNEILRASGYPRKSMSVMLTAVGINILLNPLFIFGLGWGIRGSALATLCAQSTALLVSLSHFASGSSYLHFSREIFRFDIRIIGSILSIGMAPFLMQICTSVIVIFVNRALLTYGGDISIGAYGVINRVVMLFLMIVAGLNQGMQPIVGYNYGAQSYARVREALRKTALCALCVTSAGFVVSRLFPYEIARLFVGDDAGVDAEALVAAVVYGMRRVMVAFPIVGFQIVTGNFFQYIGRAKMSIFISLTRQLIFLVPLLIILPPLFGIDGVWFSMPVADTMATLLAGVLLAAELRRWNKLEHKR